MSESDALSGASALPSGTPGRGRRVVVVDDSAVQRRLLAERLRGLGFEPVVAADAGDGLRAIAADPPCAALLDVVLPRSDGFELARRIRDELGLATIPLILFTSHDMEEESDGLLARKAGADAIVARRPGFESVLEALVGCLDDRVGPPAESPVLIDLRARFLDEGRRRAPDLLDEFDAETPSKAIRRAAHRWAGRGGTLGYPRISALARELEALVAAGDLSAARERLSELRDAFAEARPAASPGPAEAFAPGVAARLEGLRAGLVGFDGPEAERAVAALRGVGAGAESLRWSEARPDSEALERFDLILLAVGESERAEEWLEASGMAGLERPTVLVGPPHSFPGVVERWGYPAVLAPWTDSELLLRAALATGEGRGRTAPSRSPGSPAPEVVVADDDETITSLVAASLRRRGYPCHLAHDGPTALELARRVVPAAMVLDVQLPGLDGFEVLAALERDRRTRRVAVVLLTARRQESDVLRGFELGAADFVSKPFSPLELVARLERAVRVR
ncbi:MAG: response regulator [Gemmatimonadota bacterium]|nr:response regulator [Gemmatimonadota bacterium]